MEMTLEEVLKRLDMTPAELAGRLRYHMKRHNIRPDADEPTHIESVAKELESRMKKVSP